MVIHNAQLRSKAIPKSNTGALGSEKLEEIQATTVSC